MYNRDDLGRISDKLETDASGSHAFHYDYDLAGRLTQVTEDGMVVEGYSYDLNGNRTSSMNSAGVFDATFDAQDRIETYGTFVFTYTPNGELLSKTDTSTGAVTDYSYDALGNLRGVTLPDGTQIGYLVDGFGRRVGKTVNGVLVKQWLWRGRLQPVAELDGAGNVTARFVYAANRNVPSLIVTAGATYRLVKDGRGSVVGVVDVATGAAAEEISYDTWGRVLADSNPGFQAFGYGGGLSEPETGLVRFGARGYDGEIGRWTTKDPLGLDGGLNTYVYVENDPVNRTDPNGRDPIGDIGDAAAAIGEGAANAAAWAAQQFGDAESNEGGSASASSSASATASASASGDDQSSWGNAFGQAAADAALGPLSLGGCGYRGDNPPQKKCNDYSECKGMSKGKCLLCCAEKCPPEKAYDVDAGLCILSCS